MTARNTTVVMKCREREVEAVRGLTEMCRVVGAVVAGDLALVLSRALLLGQLCFDTGQRFRAVYDRELGLLRELVIVRRVRMSVLSADMFVVRISEGLVGMPWRFAEALQAIVSTRL